MTGQTHVFTPLRKSACLFITLIKYVFDFIRRPETSGQVPQTVTVYTPHQIEQNGCFANSTIHDSNLITQQLQTCIPSSLRDTPFLLIYLSFLNNLHRLVNRLGYE